MLSGGYKTHQFDDSFFIKKIKILLTDYGGDQSFSRVFPKLGNGDGGERR
jgi:hypothetical protein